MLDILYQDKEMVVVNKSEGVASIPDRRVQSVSLLEMLLARGDGRIYVVHRIDRETSGVIAFAKTSQAHRLLSAQFEARTVEKVYLALVHGVIEADEGVIDKPLWQFGSGRVGVSPQHGRDSLTEFRVLERFPAYTLVEARPRTGRRHQIRVHLYSLGRAVVGDLRYGSKAMQSAYPRLMLHALRLTLDHPSGKRMTFEAPVPESFWATLRTVPRT
jgi:RluA family pseudouridine synthase